MYVFTYITYTPLTLVAQPTALLQELLALQDLGLPFPLAASLATPYTQPHIPKAPYISTGEYNTPPMRHSAYNPMTSRRPCLDRITTPGATPPCMCICTYIVYVSLTLVAQPTAHVRRLSALQDLRLSLLLAAFFAAPTHPSTHSQGPLHT